MLSPAGWLMQIYSARRDQRYGPSGSHSELLLRLYFALEELAQKRSISVKNSCLQMLYFRPCFSLKPLILFAKHDGGAGDDGTADTGRKPFL